MRLLNHLAMALVVLPLSGCIPSMIQASDDRNNYAAYIQQMNQLNFERQKAGMAQDPIMTFDQWKGK